MSSIVQTIKQFCNSRWVIVAFPLLALLLLSLGSSSTSPLYSHDGPGEALVYDHNGPLFYLINALGMALGGRTGIFLLQVLFDSLTFWLWFRTARLVATPLRSMLACLASIALFYGNGGNIREEWMLTFLSLATYLISKGILSHPGCESSKTPIFPFLLGMCFGLVALIHLGVAVAIVGGLMLGYVMWLLVRRDIIQCLTALWMFFSATVVAVPALVWWLFVENRTLDYLLDTLFCFNIDIRTAFPLKWIYVTLPLLLGVLLGSRQRVLLWVLAPAMLLGALLLMSDTLGINSLVILPNFVLIASATENILLSNASSPSVGNNGK